MDIEALFLSYEKQPRIGKLTKSIAAKQKIMNQPVVIRDMVVRSTLSPAMGEARSHDNKYKDMDSTKRMVDHIKNLFTLVQEEHKACNMERDEDGKQRLKADKENHITRLLTHEFSFYAEKPLNIQEFNTLCSTIEGMGSQLEKNVHVLLSSFGVQDANGHIMNVVLYVEGGQPPKIHSVAKNMAYYNDINYSQKLYSQVRVNNSPEFAADFVSENTTTPVIGHGSVFEITTLGGACFTQTIDVCLDHVVSHSKNLITRKLLEDSEELIPLQVEQCVTSNRVDIIKSSQISTRIVHADPYVTISDPSRGTPALQNESLDSLKNKEYPKLSVSLKGNKYHIQNPAFGSDCIVDVIAPRAAGRYIDSLQEPVAAHNKRACIQFVERAGTTTEDKVLITTQMTSIVLDSVNELKRVLLEECRPSFWQKLFKTQEYYGKIHAEAVILERMEFILSELGPGKAEQIFLLTPWKKDLLCRLQFLAGPNGNVPLIETLKNLTQTVLQDTLQRGIQEQLGETVPFKLQ